MGRYFDWVANQWTYDIVPTNVISSKNRNTPESNVVQIYAIVQADSENYFIQPTWHDIPPPKTQFVTWVLQDVAVKQVQFSPFLNPPVDFTNWTLEADISGVDVDFTPDYAGVSATLLNKLNDNNPLVNEVVQFTFTENNTGTKVYSNINFVLYNNNIATLLEQTASLTLSEGKENLWKPGVPYIQATDSISDQPDIQEFEAVDFLPTTNDKYIFTTNLTGTIDATVDKYEFDNFLPGDYKIENTYQGRLNLLNTNNEFIDPEDWDDLGWNFKLTSPTNSVTEIDTLQTATTQLNISKFLGVEPKIPQQTRGTILWNLSKVSTITHLPTNSVLKGSSAIRLIIPFDIATIDPPDPNVPERPPGEINGLRIDDEPPEALAFDVSNEPLTKQGARNGFPFAPLDKTDPINTSITTLNFTDGGFRIRRANDFSQGVQFWVPVWSDGQNLVFEITELTHTVPTSATIANYQLFVPDRGNGDVNITGQISLNQNTTNPQEVNLNGDANFSQVPAGELLFLKLTLNTIPRGALGDARAGNLKLSSNLPQILSKYTSPYSTWNTTGLPTDPEGQICVITRINPIAGEKGRSTSIVFRGTIEISTDRTTWTKMYNPYQTENCEAKLPVQAFDTISKKIHFYLRHDGSALIISVKYINET